MLYIKKEKKKTLFFLHFLFRKTTRMVAKALASVGLHVPSPNDNIGGDSVVPYFMGIKDNLTLPMMSGVEDMDFQGKKVGTSIPSGVSEFPI